MKKSSLVAMLLGTISGVLFSLGMCMALLPEWNAFLQGVIFGAIGLLLGLVTFLVWCKIENKKLPKINKKNMFLIAFGTLGVLILGLGMCLCLVWEFFVVGTIVGLIGIVMQISLLPLTKGFK